MRRAFTTMPAPWGPSTKKVVPSGLGAPPPRERQVAIYLHQLVVGTIMTCKRITTWSPTLSMARVSTTLFIIKLDPAAMLVATATSVREADHTISRWRQSTLVAP